MSPRERIALWSAVASVLATGAGCALLLAVDLQWYVWIQGYASAAVRELARTLDVGARSALVIAIAGTLAADRCQIRPLLRAIPLVASGAAFGELLKMAIDRLRPSALPGMTTGNSLPSGHIMNTTLFAIVAWDLAGTLTPRWRRIARGIAVTAVATQAAARVLRGSHWPTDVAPSILMAIAWMLGATALWRMERMRVPLVGGAVAAYALFWAVPALRLHLPSAFDRPRTTLGTWQVDADAAAFGLPLRAAIREPGYRVETIMSDSGAPDAVEVVMRSTCREPVTSCRGVRVVVNDWTSAELGLGCGWRWYYLHPSSAALREGDNHVALVVPDGCAASDIQQVAVRSVALVTETADFSQLPNRIAGIAPGDRH